MNLPECLVKAGRAEMTPEEAREYVRAQWGQVYHGEDTVVTIYVGRIPYHFLNYIAAAEFTRKREEEIRQKREEIDLLKAEESLWPNHFAEHPAFARILATLESQLAALLVGWKEKP